MTLPVRLRLGEAADAVTLAAVASQVFLDTYATEGVRPDLAREVFELCSAQAFSAALAERQRRFVVAALDEGLVGFAEMLLQDRASGIPGVHGAELVRLYVQPRFHRSGVGRALLARTEELATEARLPNLWLTAWERNESALRFYQRMGFIDVGPGIYTYEDKAYGTRVFAKGLTWTRGRDGVSDART